MKTVPSASPADIAARLDALGAALPARGKVLIVPHDYPDPDAMASAGAVHLLLARRFGVRSQIVHSGLIARAENREMARHFRYRPKRLEDIRPPRGSLPAIFVDARPGSGNVTVPRWMKPVAVFDHHPVPHGAAPPPGLFIDIRPATGACVSLLSEYLAAAQITVPPWLAACMVYAIETETVDFTRGAAPADREAYLSLLPRASLRILGAIKHAPLPQMYFVLLREAISNARIFGRVAWSHLASVPQPEIVAEIADRLLRLQRITFSFCTAVHGETLVISMRTDRRHARSGAMLRAAIGKLGAAGGHDRMAAGTIPMAGLNDADRAALTDRIRRALLKRMEPRTAFRFDSEAFPSRPLAQTPADAPDSAPTTP